MLSVKLPGIDWEIVGTIATVVLLVLITIYAILFSVTYCTTEATCLAHGWRDSTVTWNLKSYCSREENEYEITRPLYEILEEIK